MRLYSSITSQRCLRCRLTLIMLMLGGVLFMFAITQHEEYASMQQYRIAQELPVLNLYEFNQNNSYVNNLHQKFVETVSSSRYESSSELVKKIKEENAIITKENINDTRKADKEKINPVKNKITMNNGHKNKTSNLNKNKEKNISVQKKSGGLHENEKKKFFCTIPGSVPSVFAERRDRAAAACDRLKGHLPLRWRLRTSPSPSMLSKLRWDQKHHLIYCNIPKAASTTWSWHMLRAIGVKDEIISKAHNVQKLMKKYLPYPEPEDVKTGILDHALKFLVTRHPFERLVSAYQNKIADPSVERQKYLDLQKDLLASYNEDNETGTQPKVPSFRDFCRYVIKELETWMEHDAQDGKYKPDHHWIPQTFICSPCNIKYHIFSDVSTMHSDAEYIAQQCGLEAVIKNTMKLNPSSVSSLNNVNDSNKDLLMPSSDKQPSSMIIQTESSSNYKNNDNETFERNPVDKSLNSSKYYENYFHELSELEIRTLYKLFKFDFEIFGYDIKGYLKDL